MLVGSPVHAQTQDDQIAWATLPIPESERDSATVLGYRYDELVTLREGSGEFICMADDPSDQRLQVLCYHRSLGPYMARGRALRAEGISGKANIEKRWEEIEAGELDMPRQPAALHQLFGAHPDSVSIEDADKLGRLTVIYMAYATAEETGLPGQPAGKMPWLMYPGKPTAHLMISGGR